MKSITRIIMLERASKLKLEQDTMNDVTVHLMTTKETALAPKLVALVGLEHATTIIGQAQAA
jgi:hypothetical protein